MAPTGLILLLALASTAFAAGLGFKKLINENVEKCKTTHSNVEGIMMQLLKDEAVPDGDDVKCSVACVLRGMGIIKDNKYDWEKSVALNKIKYEVKDVAKADGVSKKCNDKVHHDITDECELGEQIMECFFEEGKKVGLHPPKYD